MMIHSIRYLLVLLVLMFAFSALGQVIIKQEAEIGFTGPRSCSCPDRSNASGVKTLRVVETRGQVCWTIPITAPGEYRLIIRYSNDDMGDHDDISILVDSVFKAQFTSEGKSNYGIDWNLFYDSPEISLGTLDYGSHTLCLRLDREDGFGIEFDKLTLYSSATPVFSISGSVKDAASHSLRGVTVSFSDEGGNVSTDANGLYRQLLPLGWSGTATPSKACFSFSPQSRNYVNLNSNQSGENFVGTQDIVTVSGFVKDASNVALGGAIITFSNGGGAAITTANGSYSRELPCGWSGTATPALAGFQFKPLERSYEEVTSNVSNQNFEAIPIPSFSLSPIADSIQTPGNTFEIIIYAEDVKGVFGLSFDLVNSNPEYVKFDPPSSAAVKQDTFFGLDPVFFSTVALNSNKLSVGISCKSGQPGIDGRGPVVRIRLSILATAPLGTRCEFTLQRVQAVDVNGLPMQVSTKKLVVSIVGIFVWPGDANNDKTVNQNDVLPIGFFWERKGPARDSVSYKFKPWPVLPWTPNAATFADCNGDSTVNQADVLAIGLNWGKTHSALAKAVPPILQQSSFTTEQLIVISTSNNLPGEQFFVDVIIIHAQDLFGIAFELLFPVGKLEYIKPDTALGILGKDIVQIVQPDHILGKVSIGMVRKSGRGGFGGEGLIIRLIFKMGMALTPGEIVQVQLHNIVAMHSDGSTVLLDDASQQIITKASNNATCAVPNHFLVLRNFPNPFNTSTTIHFLLPKDDEIQMQINDLSGRLVKTLLIGKMPSGEHQVVWEGIDDTGHPVASGLYFCVLKAGDKLIRSGLSLIR